MPTDVFYTAVLTGGFTLTAGVTTTLITSIASIKNLRMQQEGAERERIEKERREDLKHALNERRIAYSNFITNVDKVRLLLALTAENKINLVQTERLLVDEIFRLQAEVGLLANNQTVNYAAVATAALIVNSHELTCDELLDKLTEALEKFYNEAWDDLGKGLPPGMSAGGMGRLPPKRPINRK